MQMIKGRWLTNHEQNPVALLNENFARMVFHERSPIGRSIRVFNRPAPSVIVGVVSDLKRFALDEDTMPEVYVPYEQFSALLNPFIAIRTTGNTEAAARSMHKLVSELDPSAPISDMETMEKALSDSIAPRRVPLFLLESFAATALLLAITGIYGIISYAVTRRTQEIGIRMAVGARGSQVVRMIVWQALGITTAGVFIGLLSALGLTRFLAGLLYDVKPNDASVFFGVALILGMSAALASWLPASRAARVDPLNALRYE